MKAPLIYILLAVSSFIEIQNKSILALAQSTIRYSLKDSIPPDTAIIDFGAQIEPIFVSHCSPCHFTGGRMYERLPFDKDITIVVNSDAILRRIKDEKEIELIQQYIQQQNK